MNLINGQLNTSKIKSLVNRILKLRHRIIHAATPGWLPAMRFTEHQKPLKTRVF